LLSPYCLRKRAASEACCTRCMRASAAARSLWSRLVYVPMFMLPKASVTVLDWSAFETPIFAQIFSSIGETADVCPAQYCGAFVGFWELCGRFRRIPAWISASDSRSLVATGTKPVVLRSWKLS